MFASLFFLIRECWLNLRRQGLMALASISTAAISLTLLGVFLLVGWQVYAVLEGAPRRLEIHAFLDTKLNAAQSQALAQEIRAIPGVSRVELISRDRAWQEYLKRSPHRDLIQGFEENPLPDKLHVAAESPTLTLQVAARIRGMPGVDYVNEGREVLRQLLNLFNIVRAVGIILGLLTALGAAAMISNAIRMTLFSRRRDIRVMQLVGATDGFIRFPFILEGMAAGAAGGALASVVLTAAISYYMTRLLPNVPLVNQFYLQLDVPTLCAALIGGGALIGMLGSVVSLRRFLHAI